MEINLKDKFILVTGGTSELGMHLVKRFCEEGAQVLFTYYQHQERAQILCETGAQGFQIDLSRRDQDADLKEWVLSKCRALDGLVLNAGIVRDKTLANMSEDEFDLVMEVNLTSCYRLIKALRKLLYAAPAAKILAISSRVGIVGAIGESNYAAAKAGMVALVKTLADELGRKGICVNAVAPGFMISRMTEHHPERVYEAQKKASYLGQYAEPAELADFLIYMLSNRVNAVTGQLFYFDSRRNKIF